MLIAVLLCCCVAVMLIAVLRTSFRPNQPPVLLIYQGFSLGQVANERFSKFKPKCENIGKDQRIIKQNKTMQTKYLEKIRCDTLACSIVPTNCLN